MFNFLKKKQKYQPIIVNVKDDEFIKEFIYNWNINCPIDKWYRDKYKIAFNSPTHRAISFIDILIEYEEFKVFDEMKPDIYEPNKGDWIDTTTTEEHLTEEEKLELYKKEFEDIDLSKYDG